MTLMLMFVQIDLRWTPEVHRFMPMLNDGVGFEHFTLEFPWTTYSGHFLVRQKLWFVLQQTMRSSDSVIHSR